MDGDTRGGAALSIKKMTGVPICFIGVGEKLPEIELFHPDRMASRILGMGDVVSLVEKAQQVIDEKDAKDLKKKILNNTFDLNDFLNQLRTIKKLGRIKDILSLIPGLNKLPIDQIDEKELVYVEAVLSSMTPKERKKPQILDGSRKARVAKGSGTEIGRVNAVLKQYETMKEMFKKVGDMARKQNNGGAVGSNYTPPKDKKKKKKK
jgi:signal recognition particle subunit SRP54